MPNVEALRRYATRIDALAEDGQGTVGWLSILCNWHIFLSERTKGTMGISQKLFACELGVRC